MDKTIYLDNAATSLPKAPGVGAAMADYLEHVGCNIGRGGYQRAWDAAGGVLAVREKLCALVNGPGSPNVCFTPGATYSLNFLLHGLLRPGDKVLTSPMEHNAVLRPLEQLKSRGVEVEYLPCTDRGELLPDGLAERLTEDVRAVVLTHASNVSGTLFPIGQVGALCRERGIFLLSGGWSPDPGRLAGGHGGHGHRRPGLPRPQGPAGPPGHRRPGGDGRPGRGAGAPGVRRYGEHVPVPVHAPLPARPAGGRATLNLPGIFGLGAALDYLAEQGEALRERERKLSRHLWYRMKELEEDGLRVLGTDDCFNRAGVVSVDFLRADNGEMAFRLEREYGVLTRVGLHCAPLAHRTLGTFPQGAVRFSVGPFTTFAEIDTAAGAVEALLTEARNR